VGGKLFPAGSFDLALRQWLRGPWRWLSRVLTSAARSLSIVRTSIASTVPAQGGSSRRRGLRTATRKRRA
jgi:hypothetical protein